MGSASSRFCCPAPRRPGCCPATKSVSYAVNMAAEAEAKRRGADDAVFVDADGIVLEGPVTNIWWREGDVLVTPSVELGILAGETRAALLALARGTGWVVEEGAYPLVPPRSPQTRRSRRPRSARSCPSSSSTAGRSSAAPPPTTLQRALRAVAEG